MSQSCSTRQRSLFAVCQSRSPRQRTLLPCATHGLIMFFFFFFLLCHFSTTTTTSMFPSGITPCKRLFPSERYFRFLSLLRKGMGPLKLLLVRTSAVRWVRFPREEEIWPAKLCPGRMSCVTRYGRVKVQLTPFHRQKWVLLVQLFNAPFGSLVMPFLKSTKDWKSSLLSWTVEQWTLPSPWHKKTSSFYVVELYKLLFHV